MRTPAGGYEMEQRAFKQGRLKSGTEQKRSGGRGVENAGEECLLVGRFSHGPGPHEHKGTHMSVGGPVKMSLYDERSYYIYIAYKE